MILFKKDFETKPRSIVQLLSKGFISKAEGHTRECQLPGHPANQSHVAKEAGLEEIQSPDRAAVPLGGEGGDGEDAGGEGERHPHGAAIQDSGQDIKKDKPL